MDQRFLRFDDISNEIDMIRAKLYSVKESIIEIDKQINPPKTAPKGKGVKTTVDKLKPRTGSVITMKAKSSSMEKGGSVGSTAASSKFSSTIKKGDIKAFNSVNFN